LRWYQSGLLVGENTHGKCYTQTIKPLSNGGALKFSNGKMLGPEGSDCSDEGLRPDVPVANSEQKSVRELLHESAKWVRAQSNRRAILDGHEAPGR
jgi:carboxyl-terminal processing protease